MSPPMRVVAVAALLNPAELFRVELRGDSDRSVANEAALPSLAVALGAAHGGLKSCLGAMNEDIDVTAG